MFNWIKYLIKGYPRNFKRDMEVATRMGINTMVYPDSRIRY